ncbi:MAG: Ig-like domain-containing protein, partial [Gammaproteobacteria bacterium]|nr:Ig-like domain-containing protein [Gammaproteobacteria bacterium]
MCRGLRFHLVALLLLSNIVACDFVDSAGRQENSPPNVSTQDIVVTEGEVGTLDGSGTTDDFGDLRSVQWALEVSTVPGLTIEITEVSTNPPVATFVAPQVSDREFLVFSLNVIDRDGSSAADTISVTINNMPSADAGEDRLITENTVAVLSGAGSTDTDGTIGDYRWVQEAGIAVNLEIDPADPTIARFVVPTIGVGVTGPRETLHFALEVTDNDGAKSADTVTIMINDGPTANDVTGVGVLEDSSVTIDVVANDEDLDGTIDPSTVAIRSAPANGNAVVMGSGEVVYTPNANFDGPGDTFTYSVNDNDGGVSNLASVNVTITPVNDPPVAVADNATLTEDTPDNALDVLANDTDPDTSDTRTITAVGTPNRGGSVSIVGAGPDNTLSYTPAPNFVGTETFTYTMRDTAVMTDSALVTVAVTNVNDPPNAVADTLTVAEDSAANAFGVLTNDTDPDAGDTRTITAVGTPNQGGSVSIVGAGPENTLSYTPAAGFVGT